MKKLQLRVGFLFIVLLLSFSLTANANPVSLVQVASYGGSYSHTMESGNGHTYILPNARTSGTSITISSSAAGTIKGHYYWSYNGVNLDLGTFTATSMTYNTGNAYYTAGTLVLVLERVDSTTTDYPSVSYTITYNN
ncbi:hypothetical protein DFQ01_105261 [Paenibacillus cellulosilyticus]|uniref:Uncharacterized protein n=1 Tax=Paenibacillus cellulosilyticus TaxID=375489 RepID=A0A2V2YWZ6_9BACL|nr:hypothetical protein [Paenibacillus cellulosilyticus]PWW05276.1 hypothetical protein DFQ01_105261 [Paenibacillus cellulosilyticus]QKS43599.1 hypothetical protein HUB94_03435 [Paenibacillus cellulosilyticus]